MEKAIHVFINIHALLGGIALIAGLTSIIAKKGNKLHKKSGLVFFYSMILSGSIAMVIALLPHHESPFLFAVGIFSLYFVLTGHRALSFKTKVSHFQIDKLISIIMILTSLLMILLPLILTSKLNIVLSVFACVGLIFSIKDVLLFANPNRLKKVWLKLHLGKMLSGYISATTAFVVVNQFFPSIYGWFIPGIIGGGYITYWSKKVTKY